MIYILLDIETRVNNFEENILIPKIIIRGVKIIDVTACIFSIGSGEILKWKSGSIIFSAAICKASLLFG